MTSKLSLLRDWLTGQYKRIDLTLTTVPTDGQPMWVDGAPEDIGGQLLDPRLGIWVDFVVVEDASAAASCVEEAVRVALEQVSRLDPKSSVHSGQDDKLGPWQVHVVWLVDSQAFSAWQNALADLRSRSSHTEELGIDVVEVSGNQVTEALDKQGLPALLLRTRALLHMPKNELPKWLSPDDQFAEALQGVPLTLADARDREHAQTFVDRILLPPLAPDTEDDGVAVPALAALEIGEFRNIVHGRIDLTSRRGDKTHIEVTHGPNGSGKSSLFEALNIALFGTSLRLCEYLDDRDIKPGDKNRYADLVLRRFSAHVGKTFVKIGGNQRLGEIAVTAEQARARYAQSGGSFLAQEDARKFVVMSANERGATFLGEYSRLAYRAQQALNEEFDKAKATWQDTLRSLGLNASISKRETISNRLALRLIDERMPRGPETIALWLQALAALRPELKATSDSLAMSWLRLDSTAAREDLAQKVGLDHAVAKSGNQTLLQWLSARRSTIGDIASLDAQGAAMLQPIKLEWERIRSDLETWATWALKSRQGAARHRTASDQPGTALQLAPAAEEAERQIVAVLRDLEAAGKLLRSRLEHFDALSAGMLAAWTEKHPRQCPTCGHDHEEEMDQIVTRLRVECDEALKSTRQTYADQSAKLKSLQAQRAATGEPPISPERRVAIAGLLNLPVEGFDSLSSRIESNPQAWQAILIPLQTLIAGPSLQSAMDALGEQSLVGGLIAQLATEIETTERLRVAPDRWAQLKKRVDEAAVSVLKAHLPSTLEAVWCEIALALAPARWNQRAKSKMKLELQRGAAKLGLVTPREGEPGVELPAWHVLNQAEQHVVGLAWFFTRHLTHGRFLTPLIALDDPAQEMDQSTYRRFVRFLQAFARMHRSTSTPLTLITFLHQEDRALELARAIDPDGELTMLSWAPEMRLSGPNANARRIRLRNPEQRAPRPAPFRSIEPAATGAA